MKKIFIFISMFFLISVNIIASEEGILPLSKFMIESAGIGNSGPIKIIGENNQKEEIIVLKIEAFGKKYQVSDEDLKKLHKMTYNGIQISFEEGYKELGGRTIYMIFQFGFTSGIEKKVSISLSENNTVEVEEIIK